MGCPKEIALWINKIDSSLSPDDFGQIYDNAIQLISAYSSNKPGDVMICAEQLRHQAYNAWAGTNNKAAWNAQMNQKNSALYHSQEFKEGFTTELDSGLHILGAFYNLEAATAPGSCKAAIANAQYAVTLKYGSRHIIVKADTPVCSVKTVDGVEALVIGEP